MLLLEKIRRADNRILLAVFFGIIFCLSYAANILSIGSSALELSTSRTISGAELLGFGAIAVILHDLKGDRVLQWWDLLAIAGILIACLYPSPAIGPIGLTFLGLLFVLRNDKRLVSLGQISIGLAWLEFWGPIVMDLIRDWLLPIETALAALPLQVFGTFSIDGNLISNLKGHDLLIAEPCSAFRNTIATTFIWLSLLKIQKLEFQRQHFVILAIGLGAVVLINTARICVMAISESYYLFWHVGPGLFIVKAVMLGVVFGLFCFCLRREKPEAQSTPLRAIA